MKFKPNPRLQRILDYLETHGPTDYDALHNTFGVFITEGGWELRNLDVTLQTGINEGFIIYNRHNKFEAIRPYRSPIKPRDDTDMMPDVVYTLGT